jgi:hypothetical protein
MMHPRLAIATGSVFVAILIAGCSSGGTDGATTTAGDNVASTTAAAEASTTVPETIETTTTLADEAVIKGLAVIEQTTPTSGEGSRPLLEWSTVNGASSYLVVVYTETGGSYWSVLTTETSTFVGGPLEIPSGRTGPSVADGYTWTVYADDADGNLLATSPRRAIAP